MSWCSLRPPSRHRRRRPNSPAAPVVEQAVAPVAEAVETVVSPQPPPPPPPAEAPPAPAEQAAPSARPPGRARRRRAARPRRSGRPGRACAVEPPAPATPPSRRPRSRHPLSRRPLSRRRRSSRSPRWWKMGRAGRPVVENRTVVGSGPGRHRGRAGRRAGRPARAGGPGRRRGSGSLAPVVEDVTESVAPVVGTVAEPLTPVVEDGPSRRRRSPGMRRSRWRRWSRRADRSPECRAADLRWTPVGGEHHRAAGPVLGNVAEPLTPVVEDATARWRRSSTSDRAAAGHRQRDQPLPGGEDEPTRRRCSAT